VALHRLHWLAETNMNQENKTDTHLTAFFQDSLGKSAPER